jgi:hypothetical protein
VLIIIDFISTVLPVQLWWKGLPFTNRNDRIRVISARDMSKKERIIYEKA